MANYKKGDYVIVIKTVSPKWRNRVARIEAIHANPGIGKSEYELVLCSEQAEERCFFEEFFVPATPISILLYA